MDRAILASYGWKALEPIHNFYQKNRGQTGFTLAPEARREVLARLVRFNLVIANQERWDGEAADTGGAGAPVFVVRFVACPGRPAWRR
jgi:hypothetical protein